MNLEQREMVFEEIMNEFIILLRPSPCMLNNLISNIYIYHIDSANLRPKNFPLLVRHQFGGFVV